VPLGQAVTSSAELNCSATKPDSPLKLCIALPTSLQRLTWQSTCNTGSGQSSTQITAAVFTVVQSKHLRSPPELQGVQALISCLQREQGPQPASYKLNIEGGRYFPCFLQNWCWYA